MHTIHKAQVSIYTLTQPQKQDEAIMRFWQMIEKYPQLRFRASALSSLIWGPPHHLWDFLKEAYLTLHQWGLMMDIKITAEGPAPQFYYEECK